MSGDNFKIIDGGLEKEHEEWVMGLLHQFGTSRKGQMNWSCLIIDVVLQGLCFAA